MVNRKKRSDGSVCPKGLSRAFDEGGRSPFLNDRGKRGPPCRLAAYDDRKVRLPHSPFYASTVPALLPGLEPRESGNKLATPLAMSTQCDYNVDRWRLNRKPVQFKVFQRQPNVIAMRRGSGGTRFES